MSHGPSSRAPSGPRPVDSRSARTGPAGAPSAGALAGPDSNPCAYLSHLGTSAHVRLDREPDHALLTAPTVARPFNTVFAPAFAVEGLDRRLREVADTHAARAPAAMWWIGPSSTPAALPEALVARGYERISPVRLMSASREAGLPDSTGPDRPGGGVDVRPVTCREELADFVAVHLAAYAMAPEEAHFTLRVLGSLSLAEDAPLRHFLVRRAGTALAAASVFAHDGLGGLYNIATVPRARRMGLATLATRAALAEAYGRGVRAVMLGAEPGAVGMYRRLGFREGAELTRLVPRPSR
ncbi:GNAT family N-acetyltransferase [Streptomyces tsukubensis]|uniref:N-acetyltransferase domain-containing protein n=1 Tax=Streptomyces tsukubensis TaxID=83656 RepID=A0A1V4ABE0_9ACTN|nr:GNAT family N-acetyltransferase [Streptomyces tsukubensis]OON80673.1 hypothetical protein B1H18_12485 [Streptomyces tsukubensis]